MCTELSVRTYYNKQLSSVSVLDGNGETEIQFTERKKRKKGGKH